MSYIKLSLAKDLARHLRAGHPWVYKQALEKLPKVPTGSIVDVVDRGHFVARGYYDPHAAVCVRILTRDERETVDAAFFRRRLAACVALRGSLLDRSETDAFRLVHGEADGLPGVVVDWYAGFAALKLYSAGLAPHREALLAALRAAAPGLLGVVGRDEGDRGEGDGGAHRGAMLWGRPAPELVPIREHGVRFLVDLYGGQKTGFFLDQRENRRLVRSLARGRTVLNCFSYTGGFSVNAALGGATRVTSIDLDRDAVALSRRNFEENGLSPEDHEHVVGDVGEALKRWAEEGRGFDLVVLDPPAFAKTQKAVEAALAGYASLNRTALSVLAPGGLLCSASCTARVGQEEFLEAIKEAAQKAGVELRLVEQRYQPPDHPIHLQFPEGRYLKFAVLYRGR